MDDIKVRELFSFGEKATIVAVHNDVRIFWCYAVDDVDLYSNIV